MCTEIHTVGGEVVDVGSGGNTVVLFKHFVFIRFRGFSRHRQSRPVVGNGGSGLSQISILVLRSDSEQVVLFRCEVRDGVLSHGQSLDQGSPVLEWGLLNLYLVGQGDVQVIVRGNKDSAPAQASLVRFLLPDLRSSNRYTWAKLA